MLTPLPTKTVASLRSRLSKAEGHRDAAVRRLEGTRKDIQSLEAEEEVLDLVATLFRSLIDNEVTENVQAVEKLITEGLQTIFEDMDLQVRANVDVSRGKVSVDLITVQKQADGSETEGSSLDAYGGSVSAVQSVLMRVIVLLKRGLRPLLLLDESMGAIADHYVPNVGKFLSLLCDRLDMDVLAVTHNPTLVEASDKAYRIKKKGGAAAFQEIR